MSTTHKIVTKSGVPVNPGERLAELKAACGDASSHTFGTIFGSLGRRMGSWAQVRIDTASETKIAKPKEIAKLLRNGCNIPADEYDPLPITSIADGIETGTAEVIADAGRALCRVAGKFKKRPDGRELAQPVLDALAAYLHDAMASHLERVVDLRTREHVASHDLVRLGGELVDEITTLSERLKIFILTGQLAGVRMLRADLDDALRGLARARTAIGRHAGGEVHNRAQAAEVAEMRAQDGIEVAEPNPAIDDENPGPDDAKEPLAVDVIPAEERARDIEEARRAADAAAKAERAFDKHHMPARKS